MAVETNSAKHYFIFKKLKMIILRPNDFFEYAFSEKSLLDSIIFYFIIQIAVFPFGLLAFLALSRQGTLGMLTFVFMIGTILSIFLFFLLIGAYHLIIKFLGGAGSYIRTYQSFLYGTAPALLLGWFPLLNLLAYAYSIYVTIIGISRLHTISAKRATLAYFIPLILMIVLMTAIFAVYLILRL